MAKIMIDNKIETTKRLLKKLHQNVCEYLQPSLKSFRVQLQLKVIKCV